MVTIGNSKPSASVQAFNVALRGAASAARGRELIRLMQRQRVAPDGPLGVPMGKSWEISWEYGKQWENISYQWDMMG